MSKTNTILVLLVAALPAAVVMYLLVMAFLGSFEAMPVMLQAVVALTLLCCAIVVLLPVYAAVAGPKSPKAAAKPKETAADEAAAGTDESDLEEADLEQAEAEEEFIEDEAAAEEAEEEDLFAAGEDEEFDYLEEEPKKK